MQAWEYTLWWKDLCTHGYEDWISSDGISRVGRDRSAKREARVSTHVALDPHDGSLWQSRRQYGRSTNELLNLTASILSLSISIGEVGFHDFL